MGKALDDCVVFAHWCQREKLTPIAGADLIRLAKLAHSAGERECNTGQSADKARDTFAQRATGIWGKSLSIEWHGLWPSCTLGAYEIRIPDIA